MLLQVPWTCNINTQDSWTIWWFISLLKQEQPSYLIHNNCRNTNLMCLHHLYLSNYFCLHTCICVMIILSSKFCCKHHKKWMNTVPYLFSKIELLGFCWSCCEMKSSLSEDVLNENTTFSLFFRHLSFTQQFIWVFILSILPLSCCQEYHSFCIHHLIHLIIMKQIFLFTFFSLSLSENEMKMKNSEYSAVFNERLNPLQR